MNVLIVTDDPESDAELAGVTLLADSVDTVSMRDGALAKADLRRPDIAVVDGRTDLVAARNLCALLRAAAPSLPILLLVAQSGLVAVNEHWLIDEVAVSGFSPGELDMRMRLAINRRSPGEVTDGEIVVGDLVLDQASHGARLADRSLNLTPTEFRLMSYLASHPGKAFTRAELLHEVWDADSGDSPRTINVHVQRLRAKLGRENERLIDTVRGVGYMVHSPQGLSDVGRQQYSGTSRPPRHLRAG